MARRNPITENDFKMKSFVSEDDLKTELFSVEIQTPKINSNVRDRSCIVTFPRIENTRLNRATVENIMKEQWGDLFNNVISYGNIDFSRRWVFNFDTLENNDRAVAKEVFINGSRIKTTHATRKFNILKIDWVPLWTNLDDLSEIIKKVGGVTGKFVDSRWGRGDRISKDSTQAILRFYKDPIENFDPPQYVHFYDEYGTKVFLHLTVLGHITKCMKCNQEGHTVAECELNFCKPCGKLMNKTEHPCFFMPRDKHKPPNVTSKEKSYETREREEPVVNNLDTNLSHDKTSKSISYSNSVTKSFRDSVSSIITNRKDEEYLGKKVSLGNTIGNKRMITPPQHEYEKTQKAISSDGEIVKNKINYSSPKDARMEIRASPPVMSPIKDLSHWPELGSSMLRSSSNDLLPPPTPNYISDSSKSDFTENIDITKESENNDIGDKSNNDLSKESELKSVHPLEEMAPNVSTDDTSQSDDKIINTAIEQEDDEEGNGSSSISKKITSFFNGSSYF